MLFSLVLPPLPCRVIVKTNGSSGASNLLFTPSGPPSRSGLIPMTATALPPVINPLNHNHHTAHAHAHHAAAAAHNRALQHELALAHAAHALEPAHLAPLAAAANAPPPSVQAQQQHGRHHANKLLNCHNFISRSEREIIEGERDGDKIL